MPIGDRIRQARMSLGAGNGSSGPAQPLLSSQRLLSKLEEAYGIGLWFWDYKTARFDWDANLRRMNGVPVDAVFDKTDVAWRRFISDDRWMIDSVVKHALPVSSWVNTGEQIDGTRSYQLCFVEIIHDDAGAPDIAIGLVQDITAQMRTEKMLSCTRLATAAAFKQGGLVTWMAALGGPLLSSSGLSELTGLPNRSFEGDAMLGLIHADDRPPFAEWRRSARNEAGASVSLRLRLRTAGQAFRPFMAHGTILEMAWDDLPVECWTCVPDTNSERQRREAMTPTLLKAARSMLGWSVLDLAEHSRVSPATITRYEAGASLNANSRRLILEAVKGAGVSLILHDDGAMTASLSTS